MEIKKTVEDLIRIHNSADPFRICQNLDIIVLRVPLVNINGFYHRYEDQDLIYLNEDLNDEESTLVLAHELGHAVLHNDVNTILLGTYSQKTTRYEIQANAFAILLLKDRLNLRSEIPLLNWRSDNIKLRDLVL